MWKRIPINVGERYVLQLCQNAERVRYLLPRHQDSPPSADMLLETALIDGDLIASYRIDDIVRTTSLVSGERFTASPHGEWFTEAERKAIETKGWNAVPWVGGVTPNLPPM
jgi:hypothetical protein